MPAPTALDAGSPGRCIAHTRTARVAGSFSPKAAARASNTFRHICSDLATLPKRK